MRKKGSVYRSMWASYILILLIPVFISIVLYYYTYGIVKNQTESYSKNLMGTIKSTCDRELEYYKNVLKEMYMNENVRTLLSINAYDAQRDSWNTYQVKKELETAYNTLLSHSKNCEDLFVYLETADKVIGTSGAVSLDLYSKTYYADGDINILRTFLQESKSGSMLHYRTSAGKEYILLTETLVKKNGRSADAVAGVWISMEDIDAKIGSLDWKGGMDWTIISDEKQVLREISAFETDTLEWLTVYESAEDIADINGVDYLVSVANSEVLDLQYMLFSPEAVVAEPVNRIRNMHLFSLILVMIVGTFVARGFMRKHYNPLRNLFNLFIKHDDGSKVENEYQYLENQISQLVHNHQNVREDAKRKRKVLRTYVLEELLVSSSMERKEGELYDEIYQKFESGSNLVLLCGIVKEYHSETEEVIKETELKRYIISNVYAEGLGELYCLEALEMENVVAFIINIPAGRENYSEVLQEKTEWLHDFVAENFRFSVYTMEGGGYPGIEGIHKSYMEACDAEDFLHYMDEIYIRYEDIKDLSVRKYDYSFEMEERVTTAIREHNPKLAISYVNGILDSNFSRREECSAEMLTCLLYDIFGTLLKASEEQGIRNDRLLTMNHIGIDSPLEDIKCFYQRMIEEICKEVAVTPGNDRGQELCQNILEYIKENYSDPDLNVSQTALHFGITPSYLSAIFKKQTGKSIMEAIRQERISNAQKLLAEGISVADVSIQVGFRERTTFIRTFKNSTGVTPGSVKKTK